MAILAFDLGGSAVKYGIWKDEALSGKGKFTTPGTWEEMTTEMMKVKEQFSNEEIEGVALSAPGAVNSAARQIEGISAIPYIHYRPIYDELKQLFQLPVAVENDANCAGLAEIFKGAAKGHQDVAFVVIGTGIGGAVFQGGQLSKGAHLYGGEFGLMFLDEGKTFSELGTAVKMGRRYCERKGLTQDALSGEEVFKLADEGDTLAKDEVNNFYNYLTRGLFSIQFTIDPEMIVLGGGVSARDGFLEEINQRMKTLFKLYDLKDFLPNIVCCEYRNDANLVGAVANFINTQNN